MILSVPGAVSVALLHSTHLQVQLHATPASSPSTCQSTFNLHHSRTMVSMLEASARPPEPAMALVVPIAKAAARWVARAIILIAFTMTPMFQLHFTHLSVALPAPAIPNLAGVARLLATAEAAARAKLQEFSALFTLHIAPRLPAVTVPAAVPALLTNLGRSSAFALGGSALACIALPPMHAAPAAEPATLALEAAVEEEEEAVPVANLLERRQLKMIVRGLPAHVSPLKLFEDFPQAVTAEALYHKTSGSRTCVVLTFDAGNIPTMRLAPSGASLTAIVHAPTPGAEYHIVAWTKPKVAVGNPPAPTSRGATLAP